MPRSFSNTFLISRMAFASQATQYIAPSGRLKLRAAWSSKLPGAARQANRGNQRTSVEHCSLGRAGGWPRRPPRQTASPGNALASCRGWCQPRARPIHRPAAPDGEDRRPWRSRTRDHQRTANPCLLHPFGRYALTVPAAITSSLGAPGRNGGACRSAPWDAADRVPAASRAPGHRRTA